MGPLLAAYFDRAKEKAGAEGRLKLAMAAKMSSKQAAAEKDSPELIELFEEAMKQIS